VAGGSIGPEDLRPCRFSPASRSRQALRPRRSPSGGARPAQMAEKESKAAGTPQDDSITSMTGSWVVVTPTYDRAPCAVGPVGSAAIATFRRVRRGCQLDRGEVRPKPHPQVRLRCWGPRSGHRFTSNSPRPDAGGLGQRARGADLGGPAAYPGHKGRGRPACFTCRR